LKKFQSQNRKISPSDFLWGAQNSAAGGKSGKIFQVLEFSQKTAEANVFVFSSFYIFSRPCPEIPPMRGRQVGTPRAPVL